MKIPARMFKQLLTCLATTLGIALAADASPFSWQSGQLLSESNIERLPDEKHWSKSESELVITEPAPTTLPVRRPTTYGLVPGTWQNFEISVEAKSLRSNEVVGRDICILFGYQDDTHFYYAHISNDANGKTHNIIMRVDGDSRTTIHQPQKPEPRLIGEWHTIHVTYASDGTIKVFVDDMKQPLMTATDSKYASGRIAVGTFDDTAEFRKVTVKPLAE